ncbi:hypothetical protein GCM10028895_32910 [Pontibacter rugosus]
MAVEQSIHILRQIRSRYVQAKLWLYMLQAIAVAAVGIAILYRWRFEVPALAFVAISMMVGAVLYFALRWRSVNKTSLQQVARHLNRQYPALEDSTEMLLHEPQNLLQRLQQQKVAGVLQELHPEKEKPYTLRSTASYVALGLALVLTAGILYLPAAPLPGPKQSPEVKITFPDAPAVAADTATTIEQIDITVTPPAYTGKKAYKADNPNLRVEEGQQ